MKFYISILSTVQLYGTFENVINFSKLFYSNINDCHFTSSYIFVNVYNMIDLHSNIHNCILYKILFYNLAKYRHNTDTILPHSYNFDLSYEKSYPDSDPVYIYRLTPIKLGSLNMLWSIFFVGQFLPRFNSIHLYPLVFVATI